MPVKVIRYFVLVLVIVEVMGCKKPTPLFFKPSQKAGYVLVKLQPDFVKRIDFHEGDFLSLERAVRKSLEYFNRLPSDRKIRVGELVYSVVDFRKSLEIFLDYLRRGFLPSDELLSFFDFYVYKRGSESGQVFVTGYYEPIIDGSMEKTEIYKYPVYPLPRGLIKVVLSDFGLNCNSRGTLFGRIKGNRLVPFYSRKEIDSGVLEGTKPLFWAKDPVDVFFLQIQGSGVVRFPDGSTRRIGYAGTNGRPYRSIGRYMIEKGWVSKDKMSMQAIREFFRENPEKMWDTFWYNESYVFFRWVDSGPKGSLNVLLTPMKSVASDPRYYPRGALSFLITDIPFEEGVKVFSSWVLHQDCGGAIKGPSRLDLFFGTGNKAGNIAGRMKYKGILILALPKSDFANSGEGSSH